jgi:indole-3-glycerol phosphate synthase
MHEILTDIVRRKRIEMAEAKALVPLDRLTREARMPASASQFKERLLSAKSPAIIAEIKIASPTHQNAGLARRHCGAGASLRAR